MQRTFTIRGLQQNFHVSKSQARTTWHRKPASGTRKKHKHGR